MAAPTSVRVEATSITSTVIRWSYSGASSIGVYRSIDGSVYSLINANDLVVPGTTTYTDTGLSTATKYWYKLSDDVGATFSSVVTVSTHTCGVSPSLDSDATLPRAGDEVTSDTFNDLAIRVETGLTRFIDPEGRVCTACISDGALVLDCVNFVNCEHIEVEVTENVNSISLPNCENDIKTIDFLIPPGTTREICGWPGGSGFSGDECTQAPVSGGTAGRTISVSPNRGKADPKSSGSRPGWPGGGGGGVGSGCTCVPNGNGQLTIKSCNTGNSLNCSSTKSLKLIVCGGHGPYTWSKTGSVVLSSSAGTTTTVTPPTNSGSGVAGDAYHRQCGQCITCTGATCTNINTTTVTFGCNDTATQACTTGISACGGLSTTASDYSTPCCPDVPTPPCAAAACPPGACPSGRTSVCDIRTAPMIAAGCSPCGINSGATVSVTDSLGTVTTIILAA